MLLPSTSKVKAAIGVPNPLLSGGGIISVQLLQCGGGDRRKQRGSRERVAEPSFMHSSSSSRSVQSFLLLLLTRGLLRPPGGPLEGREGGRQVCSPAYRPGRPLLITLLSKVSYSPSAYSRSSRRHRQQRRLFGQQGRQSIPAGSGMVTMVMLLRRSRSQKLSMHSRRFCCCCCCCSDRASTIRH